MQMLCGYIIFHIILYVSESSLKFLLIIYDYLRYFVIGDFNKAPIRRFGLLQNVQGKATEKGRILNYIITNMHTSYLPSILLDLLGVTLGLQMTSQFSPLLLLLIKK